MRWVRPGVVHVCSSLQCYPQQRTHALHARKFRSVHCAQGDTAFALPSSLSKKKTSNHTIHILDKSLREARELKAYDERVVNDETQICTRVRDHIICPGVGFESTFSQVPVQMIQKLCVMKPRPFIDTEATYTNGQSAAQRGGRNH
jgi:hypothetical protein